MQTDNEQVNSIRMSVARASDITRALSAFSEMVQDFGFSSTDWVMSNRNFRTWNDRLAQAQLRYVNFPRDWERRWPRYARVDPLLQASSQAHWPIRIEQLCGAPGQSDLLTELWNYLADSDLSAGFVVPVHLPRGAFATLALYCKAGTPQTMFDPASIFMIGQVFCRAMSETFFTEAEPAPFLLSTREVECLYLASTGKTAEEIGQILGRSPKTARFHLERAAQKLGANNRASAVAKACFGGHIQPN